MLLHVVIKRTFPWNSKFHHFKVYDCDNKSNFGERKVIVTRKNIKRKYSYMKHNNVTFKNTFGCHFSLLNLYIVVAGTAFLCRNKMLTKVLN